MTLLQAKQRLTHLWSTHTNEGAGIMFVCRGTKRCLWLRRAGDEQGATWCFPGGGIELGETPEQAARRETREEVGYDYAGPLSFLGDITTDGYTFHNFYAVIDEEFEPALNPEHDQFIWSDEMPEPVLPNLLKVLEHASTGNNRSATVLRV